MKGSSGGRVIVGVDDSPAGLRALHAAVAEARALGRELMAVRAYPVPSGAGAAPPNPLDWRLPRMPQPPTSEPWDQLQAACEQRELRTVTRAFEHALGGLPPDVRVNLVAAIGRPGHVLVAAAHRDDDLLVVGKPPVRRLRRLWPWRWFHRSTCRYCAKHAACPVLTVPEGDLVGWNADDSLRRSPQKKALDDVRPPLHADHEHHDTHVDTVDDGAIRWPTRACCCSAPPQVKILIPAGNGRPVDLYLCGHHYRASIGPLVIADAIVHFRNRPSTVSLAAHT
ncbi:universal stress protein [Streptomyces sp. NPDC102394]|uniref:universal stress protein n=1 Tax=Streptomyces sp. NPDC102394 TaxID=3366167 RepID=UPI0037F4BD79